MSDKMHLKDIVILLEIDKNKIIKQVYSKNLSMCLKQIL